MLPLALSWSKELQYGENCGCLCSKNSFGQPQALREGLRGLLLNVAMAHPWGEHSPGLPALPSCQQAPLSALPWRWSQADALCGVSSAIPRRCPCWGADPAVMVDAAPRPHHASMWVRAAAFQETQNSRSDPPVAPSKDSPQSVPNTQSCNTTLSPWAKHRAQPAAPNCCID